MSEPITDEIVEALGRRRYEDMVRLDKYPENWPAWEDFHGDLKERVTEGVRADLETVAPLIAARALEEAAEAFDLDVASVRFIASDGYPSVGINTNDEARTLVTDWLRARAKEGRG